MTINATYHGITEVECMSCGVKTNDVSTMELLNDLDMLCNECDTRNRKWTLTDGSSFITRETAKDSDEFERIEVIVAICDTCKASKVILNAKDKDAIRGDWAGVDFYDSICHACWEIVKEER